MFIFCACVPACGESAARFAAITIPPNCEFLLFILSFFFCAHPSLRLAARFAAISIRPSCAFLFFCDLLCFASSVYTSEVRLSAILFCGLLLYCLFFLLYLFFFSPSSSLLLFLSASTFSQHSSYDVFSLLSPLSRLLIFLHHDFYFFFCLFFFISVLFSLYYSRHSFFFCLVPSFFLILILLSLLIIIFFSFFFSSPSSFSFLPHPSVLPVMLTLLCRMSRCSVDSSNFRTMSGARSCWQHLHNSSLQSPLKSISVYGLVNCNSRRQGQLPRFRFVFKHMAS